MHLMGLDVDDSSHDRDGLLLRGWDGGLPVIAFIDRRVMNRWASCEGEQRFRLSRVECNQLGRRNIQAIERIARVQYQRGYGFRCQPQFVDILSADIVESGERLDMRTCGRETVPMPHALLRLGAEMPALSSNGAATFSELHKAAGGHVRQIR